MPSLQLRKPSFLPLAAWQFLLYAGPCILVWTVYFAAFFPGMMSRDSLDQWIEVVMFRFSDWHPAFNSFLYWLLTRIWFSPAIICLVQLVALASVFAYGMVKLERRNLPQWALLLLVAFFSLFPINGFYVNTIFKDVPFGIVMLLLFIYSIEIFESDGAWLKSNWNIFYLSLVLALVWLFRHNGLLTSLATIAGLFVFYFSYSKRIVATVIGCLVLVFLVKGPLYKAINANGHVYALDILLTHQIGAAIHDGAQLTPSEKEVINRVLPLPLWKKNYNPFQSDELVFHKQFNYKYLAEPGARDAYVRTWYSLMKRNLPTLFAHQLKVTELVWRLDHQKGSYTYAVHPLIDDNDLGLTQRPLSTVANGLAMRVYYHTEFNAFLRPLLFRPALYIYLSLLFVAATVWLTKNRKYLLVALPLLSIVAGILLTIPAQHVRYLYPCFLLAPFLGAYFLLYLIRYRNTVTYTDSTRTLASTI